MFVWKVLCWEADSNLAVRNASSFQGLWQRSFFCFWSFAKVGLMSRKCCFHRRSSDLLGRLNVGNHMNNAKLNVVLSTRPQYVFFQTNCSFCHVVYEATNFLEYRFVTEEPHNLLTCFCPFRKSLCHLLRSQLCNVCSCSQFLATKQSRKGQSH